MSWEDSFLRWFASQDIHMTEEIGNLGGLKFHLFSSAFEGTDGKLISAFGCAEDRKTSAIKCAAESVERKSMDVFFNNCPPFVSAPRISLNPRLVSPQDDVRAPLPPKGMRTSNGWAAHSTAQQAISAACLEALERHLLIKSFYRWGWEGFRLVQQIETDKMQLFFLSTRLTSADYIGGIVIAKSPLYAGVSFGYCVGLESSVAESSFWQSALFEASSKIIALGGQLIEVRQDRNAWLRQGVKDYLEQPFDLKCLQEGSNTSNEADDERECFLKTFDLAQAWQLEFPLFSAFCWGGNVVPLCDPSILDQQGREYFDTILSKNSLSLDVPARHPIL
jgi:hypothetical protein